MMEPKPFMVSHMVRMKARNPANLFQQYTMPAVRAAMPVMISPIGLAFMAAFSNHCTPAHTLVAPLTTVMIAP